MNKDKILKVIRDTLKTKDRDIKYIIDSNINLTEQELTSWIEEVETASQEDLEKLTTLYKIKDIGSNAKLIYKDERR